MKPTKLVRDYKALEQPQGTYPYGKNGVWNKQNNALQNEPGFRVSSANIPYTLLGLIETDTGPIIFSGNGTYSAIGKYEEETDTYTSIFTDRFAAFKLEFKVDGFIQGEARRNYRDELEVTWLEEGNPPRFLNTVDVPTSLKGFLLFPEAKEPDMEVSLSDGGALPMGTYYAAVKLLRIDGTETRYFTPSKPLFAATTNYSASPGASTGKALQITLSDLDQSYDSAQIAVIRKVNGVTTAVELSPIRIPGDQVIFSYSDQEGEAITLEEILIPAGFYENAKAITQLNDILYLADIEEAENIDLQPSFLNAKVQWKSELMTVEPPDPRVVSGEMTTFKHGEVYALYGVATLTSGQKTRAFHIPGPDVSSLDFLVDSGMSIPTRYETKAFQLDDTSTVLPGTSEGVTGGWINDVERYPNLPEFGTLAGKKVRHHRMPTIQRTSPLHNSDPKYGVTKLDCLGLKITDLSFPSEYAGIIDSVELYYAKRSYGNSLITAQGAVLFGARFGGTPDTEVYSTGGNFESGGNPNTLRLAADSFRFYSVDTMLNRPTTHPSYLQMNRLVRIVPTPADTINGDQEKVIIKLDYTKGTREPEDVAVQCFVDSTRYIINNESGDDVNNIKAEGTFVGNMGARWATGGLPSPLINLHLDPSERTSGATPIPHEEMYIADMYSSKRNLYVSYYSQQLVRTGAPSEDYVFGGDCFLCSLSINTHGVGFLNDTEWGENDSQKPEFGTRIVRRFILESNSNLWQRYYDLGIPASKFWPQQDTGYLEDLRRDEENNYIALSQDAKSVGDLLNGIIPQGIDMVNIEHSPYKIIRSSRQSREGRQNSWKNFNALDYFEVRKDLGPIRNLQGFGDRLIIHMRNALLVTRDKTTLQGDILSVTLGSGDIFRMEPAEGKVSKLGYAGIQHPLSASFTEYGYVFPDTDRGTLFVLNDRGLQDINSGMYNFLNAYLRVSGNPLRGLGITTGYDERFKRLLVTCGGDNPFTLSYDTVDDKWAFFHDYWPSSYFHTRKGLFNIHNAVIYENNEGVPGKYHTSERKDFFIDVTFVMGEEASLNSVSWITEVTEQSHVGEHNITLEKETLTAISIWNNRQCSGRIELAHDNRHFLTNNSRSRNQIWSFNDFRNQLKEEGVQFLENIFNDFNIIEGTLDTNQPWYEVELMEGTFFIVRFEFKNQGTKQITIHDVEANVSRTIY